MKRTVEMCRERLVLCTLVAEHLARILLRGSIERVGLYGSVARREPGHFCRDVNLIGFVTLTAVTTSKKGNESEHLFLHRIDKSIAWYLRCLGLGDIDQEITQITRGFVTHGDSQAAFSRREDIVIPTSLRILPVHLTVDAMCALQAGEADPQFVMKIGRDYREFDPTMNGFVLTDPPWQNLPWQERLPHWLREEEVRRANRDYTDPAFDALGFPFGRRPRSGTSFLICPRCRELLSSLKHIDHCI